MLIYKGYTATVEYDVASGRFMAEVDHILEPIQFEADRVEDLPLAFEEAIEAYFQDCEALGLPPEKPNRAKAKAGKARQSATVNQDVQNMAALSGTGLGVHEFFTENIEDVSMLDIDIPLGGGSFFE